MRRLRVIPQIKARRPRCKGGASLEATTNVLPLSSPPTRGRGLTKELVWIGVIAQSLQGAICPAAARLLIEKIQHANPYGHKRDLTRAGLDVVQEKETEGSSLD